MPSDASQTRAVWSFEAVTTREPSGLNAAEDTPPACPFSTAIGLPSDASQTRAVWSFLEVVTTRDPSGLNTAEYK